MAAGDPHLDEPETDWSWVRDESPWIPPNVEADGPSPARMYDYALGGKDNFAADRAVVDAATMIVPQFRSVALANREFLIHTVETMAHLGIDQFIDVGAGLPTAPNVHDVARTFHPQARVVYIDNDPIVMAHNRALLGHRRSETKARRW
jgi:hypothetical protein